MTDENCVEWLILLRTVRFTVAVKIRREHNEFKKDNDDEKYEFIQFGRDFSNKLVILII